MRMLGFAPIREMLDANICVSLGTDGAPSNNRMSIVDEMYIASLINKGREVYATGTTNPTILPAETLLNMATINGAKALLLENDIGSLQVGKKADMIVINPSSWSMVPIHDWYIYTTLIILQIMGLCSFPIKSCRVTCSISISIKYSIVSYI